MPTLLNTFATGEPAGTSVSAATSGNGTAGHPFDVVTVGAGNTLKIAATGGADVVIGASAGQPAYIEWSTSLLSAGTAAPLYAEIGFDMPAAPGTGLALLRGMSGTAQRWRVELTTGRQIQMRNAANGAIGALSAALATGTHWRVEVAAAAHNTAGEMEVRIYAGNATTPTEVLGPLTGQVLGGPVTSIRAVVAASASPATATNLHVRYVGASTVTWLGPAVPTPTVTHTWVGAVTHNSVVASYGLANVASARLVVSTSADLSSPTLGPAVTVDANGLVKLTATGLTPNTLYHVGIQADGTVLGTGRASFRSDPTPNTPTSFSVAFTSCNQTNSNSETFAAVATREGPYGIARRMMHEGDWHYRDFGAGTTLSDVVNQWKSTLAPARMQLMLTTVPTTATWDNHDWGGPNSDASAPAGPHVAAGYRLAVPHYPLPTPGTTAIYQSWVIGRVRFIQLDTRSQRSPRTDAETSAKTMLGVEQKAWFKAQLLMPEPLKVVVSGIYWRRDSATGDRWGSYSTEWNEIRDFALANAAAIGKVIVVSGDRHALYADDGSGAASSGGTYWPNVSGAPADQGTSEPFEPWSHGYYYVPGNMRAYGVLDITDNGAGLTVQYSGITALDGITRVSLTLDVPAAAALPARWGIHL